MSGSKYAIISGLMFAILLALLVGLFALVFSLVKVLSQSTIFKHLIGRDVAGVSYGLPSSGDCSVTFEYNGIRPPAAKGKISRESHLVTQEEAKYFDRGWPSNKKDGIQRHLEITKFKQNCPGCNPNSQQWTPAEGGAIGQGSTEKPPASLEPWSVNSRWYKNGRKTNPPPGTRVILFAPKTNRWVVGVAGFEWGPGSKTGHTFGAQPEVLHALGIQHGDMVVFGFAKDQSLPPGPISCNIGPQIVGGKILNVPCIGEDYPRQCGVASTAMVIAYLTGKYFTTSQLAGKGQIRIDETLNTYTKIKWKRVQQNRELAIKSINAGYPVIIYNQLYGIHIIVLRGYDSQGYFYYNDPLRNKRCKPMQKKRWGEWGCHPSAGCLMIIPAHIK